MHLYIIGNGFDLHHGMKTAYIDFAAWLLLNDLDDTFDAIENILGDLGDRSLIVRKDDNDLTASEEDELREIQKLWSDFENQLAKTRALDIVNEAAEENPVDLSSDHCDRMWEDAAYSAKEPFDDAYNKIDVAFRQWLKSLECPVHRPRLNIDRGGIFLTFNYTDTLTRLYGVSDSRLLYIHGSALRPADRLVLGHGKTYDQLSEEMEREMYSDLPADLSPEEIDDTKSSEETHHLLARQAAATVVAERRKPVEEIIAHHAAWFDTLADVDRITILGHSVNDIDLPYYEEILRHVDKSRVHVTVACYTLRDYVNAIKTRTKFGIPHQQFRLRSWNNLAAPAPTQHQLPI